MEGPQHPRAKAEGLQEYYFDRSICGVASFSRGITVWAPNPQAAQAQAAALFTHQGVQASRCPGAQERVPKAAIPFKRPAASLASSRVLAKRLATSLASRCPGVQEEAQAIKEASGTKWEAEDTKEESINKEEEAEATEEAIENDAEKKVAEKEAEASEEEDEEEEEQEERGRRRRI